MLALHRCHTCVQQCCACVHMCVSVLSRCRLFLLLLCCLVVLEFMYRIVQPYRMYSLVILCRRVYSMCSRFTVCFCFYAYLVRMYLCIVRCVNISIINMLVLLYTTHNNNTCTCSKMYCIGFSKDGAWNGRRMASYIYD